MPCGVVSHPTFDFIAQVSLCGTSDGLQHLLVDLFPWRLESACRVYVL